MTDRVRLCLRGRMAEKFIGRALKEGIRFQRVERSGAREMMLSATERDAERLMELAGQLGIELTVVGEAGLPLVRKRFLQRLTLPVAPLLSLLLKPEGRLTIAHGWSRERINAHHAGAAQKVSNGLMEAINDALSQVK